MKSILFTKHYMGTIGLFLSGAVLFLNGLFLIGKADGKSIAYFNLFVGAIQTISPLYLVFVSDQTNWTLYNYSSIFLFGLTYLFLAVTIIKDLNGNGLGYFSLWVSIISVVYTLVSIIQFGDIANAITWAFWAYLWFLFYLSMSCGKEIDAYTGRVAIVLSWVTLTIPSMFTMTGISKEPAAQFIWYTLAIATILYFLFLNINKGSEKQLASK